MNKAELAAAIAERTNLKKKDADAAVAAFTEVVIEELQKGEKVAISGFGVFETIERKEREGRNPKSGETLMIAASKAPKFRPGKNLKDSVK